MDRVKLPDKYKTFNSLEEYVNELYLNNWVNFKFTNPYASHGQSYKIWRHNMCNGLLMTKLRTETYMSRNKKVVQHTNNIIGHYYHTSCSRCLSRILFKSIEFKDLDICSGQTLHMLRRKNKYPLKPIV